MSSKTRKLNRKLKGQFAKVEVIVDGKRQTSEGEVVRVGTFFGKPFIIIYGENVIGESWTDRISFVGKRVGISEIRNGDGYRIYTNWQAEEFFRNSTGNYACKSKRKELFSYGIIE